MPVPANLVHQTSVTTGTGPKTLSAVNGKRTFLAAFGTGGTDTFDYYISNRDAAEWERGTGHENAGTLVADTVIESSNSDVAVNFSAGTKDITNDVPAAKQVTTDTTQTLTNKDISSATNTYRAASETVTGAVELATTAEAAAGTDTSRAVTAAGLLAAVIGRFTVGAAAGSLFPATTNGCAALAQAETATNKINYKYLAFDPSAVEYAWFAVPSPKSQAATTLKMRAVWTHPATATNFGVVWQYEMFAAANDDALDTALGTAITTADTGGTTQDFYAAPESAAITPSNTLAKQDWIFVRVGRLVTDGSDTMAVDAHLIGVEYYYDTDAFTDD